MEEKTISTFGDFLKEARQNRKITQQELAVRLGTHRNTIGMWERGDFLPESKAMVLELARQLQFDTQDTQRLLEASLTALAIRERMLGPHHPKTCATRTAFIQLLNELGHTDQAKSHTTP